MTRSRPRKLCYMLTTTQQDKSLSTLDLYKKAKAKAQKKAAYLQSVYDIPGVWIRHSKRSAY